MLYNIKNTIRHMFKIKKDLAVVENINDEIQAASKELYVLRLKKSTMVVRDTSQFKKLKRYIQKLKTKQNQG